MQVPFGAQGDGFKHILAAADWRGHHDVVARSALNPVISPQQGEVALHLRRVNSATGDFPEGGSGMRKRESHAVPTRL
jgi:hypothetical protein